MVTPIAVRHAQDSDLDAVVAVHQESFAGFFLTFLGPRFLRLLYTSMLEDHRALLIVAESESRVVGFVGGVESQSTFYRRLVSDHLVEFGLAATTAVVRKPTIARRLIRALNRSSESSAAAANACLMSIAVARVAEGQGIGRILVKTFSDEFRQRGILSYCLTTDRDDNERTNRFYQNLGFRLASTFVTPEGRAMNEYVISLEQ